MSHEKDKIGYPTDPKLRQLEFRLGDLVGEWRGSFDSSLKQEQIVQEYHSTMQLLYDLGWDDILDAESELPDQLMPPEYLRRHPTLDSKIVWTLDDTACSKDDGTQ